MRDDTQGLRSGEMKVDQDGREQSSITFYYGDNNQRIRMDLNKIPAIYVNDIRGEKAPSLLL